MDADEHIMNTSHDHIMANTWRLIFERQPPTALPPTSSSSKIDFSLLEQLLPEYRLIGLILADKNKQRRWN